MRAIPTWTLLAVFLLVLTGSPVLAQDEEVVPPEERDVIEAEGESLPDEIPGEIPDEKDEKAAPGGASRTQAEEEHTVVPGDTLWDLCARYLNNPWYWPRVWSYNPEITNPHWIYPGQTVRFFPGGELPSEILVSDQIDVPEMVEEPEEEEVPEDLVQFMSGKGIIKAKRVTAVHIKRDAFVTEAEMEDLGHIKGSREEKWFLGEYDPVYIEFKNPNAAQVGQQFMIIRTIKEIYHPITDELEGYFTRVLGSVQIVNVEDTTATAIVATSLDPIERGDRVVGMMPQMTKHVAPRANAVELKGYILDSRVEVTEMGEAHVVFIDQGTQDGVQEGNVFDCVRREDGYIELGKERVRDKWDENFPIEIFGRILIVDARPTASTGIVMASMRELHRGDRVLMSMR